MPSTVSTSSIDPLEQPRGFTIRAKILAGFSTMILLMTIILGMTLYKMSAIEKMASQAIEQRQPAVHLLLRMSAELNLATTLLNGYLLTGSEDSEKKYLALENTLKNRMEEALVLEVLGNTDTQNQLLEIDEHLNQLLGYGKTVIYLRNHPEENYPGLALARTSINVSARRFLGMTNILIHSDDLDLTRREHRWFFYLLQELRYTWIQMMSNMRLSLTTRRTNDLKDVRTYLEQNGKILKELQALDMDIGFGELDEMAQTREEYVNEFPAVIEIIQSPAWRVDANIMRKEVQPIVDQLRQQLTELVNKQLETSVQSGYILTESLSQLRIYAAAFLLIAILVGLLIAISITRGLIPSIQRLVLAARQVANGDLNAEVFLTSKDELGLLGQSFNSMVSDLRSAALNEHQHTEELVALNQNLEKRVKARTIELEHTEARTRAILENIGEGIVTINKDGSIESTNPAAEHMFLLSKQKTVGMHSALLLADEALADISELDNYDDEVDGVFRIRDMREPVDCWGKRTDGSIFPMEFVVSSMMLGDKSLRVCILRDISARKEAEKTLAKAQHQLVDAAHKSGMAEMATGVLHNIGNILNSVNLSSEEIARISANSKVKGFIKANEMLMEHRYDLGSFITHDNKGKKLPDYYVKLGGILAQEIKNISEEAKLLIGKTNMMKEVISTQQAYAHAGFHNEQLVLNELIEDALKIQESSLHKRGVKVRKKYAELPACIGQKSKLLQILTNLIKNAKEAMYDNDIHNKPKELNIETGQLDSNAAFIKISDNGCGIDENQLSKIFCHGFTTKQEGHGFGLHSSANAMTEMKGALKVDSNGSQQGATFTITIPVYQAA